MCCSTAVVDSPAQPHPTVPAKPSVSVLISVSLFHSSGFRNPQPLISFGSVPEGRFVPSIVPISVQALSRPQVWSLWARHPPQFALGGGHSLPKPQLAELSIQMQSAIMTCVPPLPIWIRAGSPVLVVLATSHGISLFMGQTCRVAVPGWWRYIWSRSSSVGVRDSWVHQSNIADPVALYHPCPPSTLVAHSLSCSPASTGTIFSQSACHAINPASGPDGLPLTQQSCGMLLSVVMLLPVVHCQLSPAWPSNARARRVSSSPAPPIGGDIPRASMSASRQSPPQLLGTQGFKQQQIAVLTEQPCIERAALPPF